jgi:hypothetical protein
MSGCHGRNQAPMPIDPTDTYLACAAAEKQCNIAGSIATSGL